MTSLLAIFVFAATVAAADRSSVSLPVPTVVDLKATDGVVLKASYFASATPGPGVLLLHQGNRQRKVWDDLAARLAAAGIDTLTFDMRGYGESGGTPHERLTSEQSAADRKMWPDDVDTAWRFLISQPGIEADVIGIGGAGYDGVFNAVAAARRHAAAVKSLVLLSGQTDLAGRQFLRSTQQLPALFVVADNDEYPPTVETMEMAFIASSNPDKRFVHYSGERPPWKGFEDRPGVPATGGHGTDLFQSHPELPSTIVDWFATTLVKTPGRAPVNNDGVANLPFAAILDQIEMPGGTEQVAQLLTDARQKNPAAQLWPEAMVDIMGYDHLRAGETKLAVEILKLNVTAYPGSPDAHDSLSDAFLADGEKELARRNAMAALSLLASDTNDSPERRAVIRDGAEQKIKQIEAGYR